MSIHPGPQGAAPLSSTSRHLPWRRRPAAALATPVVLLLLTGCFDSVTGGGDDDLFSGLQCSIPVNELFAGGPPPDGIPSLQNPAFVAPDDPAAGYLLGSDRVIGLVVEGQAYAVPHNIGWWHEIVNLDFPGGLQLAVTYCPLTGSSLTFDRTAAMGAGFGVSGVLFRNNLVLFDRNQPASLWLQMGRQARCGPADGTPLGMFPSIETTWDGWKELHPDTRVVGGNIGMGRNYQLYPYGNYEESSRLLFPQGPLDTRRFVKERTLGIPHEDGSGAVVFPFGLLRDSAEDRYAVVSTRTGGRDVVVFWDGDAAGAMAFYPEAGGQALEFRVEEGQIVDVETGSHWLLDGRAVAGPLEGLGLAPVPEAYVAFWFAWIAFHPEAEIWKS